MGINFGEMKQKAQEQLGKHSDKVEQGLDKAGKFAKSRFGDHSEKIDNATRKAKDALHRGAGDEGKEPPNDQGGGQRPPQGQ
ncbi:antitoxin [Amycolatopsis cihanbeyliensis]|uniref:Antitoxin protein of toxin-antitoxin system n=1 Tax=Amycolatopsis cihanbeyliensis TaxID=1128664 RepID=A0A542DMJ8_AMYCI|nr:antitoxin [Amycolatopsis cihanbeyliensis]TQJ04318.1 antitoxin protein of toxin-antitoxin system [Amycolatopsis cihanbeyliensis]